MKVLPGQDALTLALSKREDLGLNSQARHMKERSRF